MPTLYVVATPIGNLSDMTPRAVETLRRCAFIAAEDTRVTQKLLTHFRIETRLVSNYDGAVVRPHLVSVYIPV